MKEICLCKPVFICSVAINFVSLQEKSYINKIFHRSPLPFNAFGPLLLSYTFKQERFWPKSEPCIDHFLHIMAWGELMAP
jgi:hypothetical protein